jgi:homogentisate 1,2-dioxygenase
MNYQSGLMNLFETEARLGALPPTQNSPQKAPLGLYAEHLSGSAFTAPRALNLRSWTYRIRPTSQHEPFDRVEQPNWKTAPLPEPASPNQHRWNPLTPPTKPTSFFEGVTTMVANGSAGDQKGLGCHLYFCNSSQKTQILTNSDAEMIVLPEKGGLLLETELGSLEVLEGELACIPRGLRFRATPLSKSSRGYLVENYGAPFRLPELGPIGINGLANPHHFKTPVAWFEDLDAEFEIINKFSGQFWRCTQSHSPLDVVAWRGNYAPYKYDLRLFNTIGSISYDHPDPSIFTVLTSPSEVPGTANCDFVIFPPRWLVAENTFRPPWFHRNVMSEWMGLLFGAYDAKETGFVPGGSSLHNCLSGHGPDLEAFEKASNAMLAPKKLDETMAFMFESRYPFQCSKFAMQGGLLQTDYHRCWQGLKKHFKG